MHCIASTPAHRMPVPLNSLPTFILAVQSSHHSRAFAQSVTGHHYCMPAYLITDSLGFPPISPVHGTQAVEKETGSMYDSSSHRVSLVLLLLLHRT